MKRAWLLMALALVGCSTVFRARQAQESVRQKGLDAAPLVVSMPLDFRGRSLEYLVDFALTNRPSIVSARLAVEDARLTLKSLAADAPILSETPWTAPHLSLSGSYSESSEGTTLRDHKWKTKGDPSAALSLELLVYDFGRYAARAKAQAERVVSAEQTLAQTGFTVFQEVSQAYFTFFESRSKLEVARTNEIQYADALQRAEERVKAGDASQLDVLKARLDLATARQTVVSASNAVATAGATLMQTLGVDAARGTATTAFGTDSLGVNQVYGAFARTTDEIDFAFEFSRTNAPSLRVMRAKLRAASHAVDVAVADLRPSLSVSTALSWTDPLWFWSWGVSAAQTIFQGFKKTTAIDQAVVALEQASVAVDQSEQELSLSLEKAISTRNNASIAFLRAQASVRSARENLDLVQEQFIIGAASRVELSEAIASLSSARADVLTAYYAGQCAEAELFVLEGRTPVYQELSPKEVE